MARNDTAKNFLGAGFAFPVETYETTGRFKMAEYEDDIKQAIYIILMTRQGERVMRPDFGCRVHEYTFGTMDYTTVTKMENAIKEALTIWEPRIIDIEVEADTEQQTEGKLIFEIGYTVRSTNNPFNLVYPFYINEGFGAGE